ncbi:glutamate--tRNA ligase [Patescibacteria group bacterium]|nr:glutamate--tRNA ligase [Patescibacteria group bacterium]
MSPKIKTRFAPSPTGQLHIGGLRTALYNYLFTKQHKGKFVLRIEDTDRSRYVENAEIKLIQTLSKIGLNWDEGPVMGKTTEITEKGQNKPYFQSKRVKIYQEYAEKLIKSGNAYYCFCSEDRLKKLREKQQQNNQPTRYDGLCRKLSETEIQKKLQNQEPFVIRLKVPQSGEVTFKDIIRGQVKIQTEDIDDQILFKSDGFPTYHLANVVDDNLMGITHVIRGEEWLPSTPKHILLYRALGWTMPQFAHLPLLLNPDRSKLSKRQSDVSVEDYLDKGYLPEALLNYVALLGWHPKDDKEIFSLKNLIKHFDLQRVQKAGAIFDLKKLKWLNCHYIKQKPVKELVKLCEKFLPEVDSKLLTKILEVEKTRIEYLGEVGELAEFFIKLADYPAALLIFKKSNKEKTLQGLKTAEDSLNNLKSWNKAKILQTLTKATEEFNLTNGDVFWPVRVAASGKDKSPAPEEILEILGKEEGLKRIKLAREKLNML